MVFDVQAHMAFSTAQRRNQVLNAVENRVASKQRFGADLILSVASRLGANGLAVELRFVSQADADDLRAHLEDTLVGQLLPLAGSWVRVHSCTHDEGANVCAPSFERTW